MVFLMISSMRISVNLLVLHIGRVLVGNDDGVDADGLVALVLDGDLRLAVGAQPGDLAALAGLAESFAEIVRVHDRRGHQLGRLGAGETKHQSLVARALLGGGFAFGGLVVHALRDVGALFDDGAGGPGSPRR